MSLWGEAFPGGPKPFDFRIERLIALARAALAAFALLAVYLDPSEPSSHSEATFTTLLGYLVLAGLVAIAALSAKLRASWILPLHLADIGIVSVLMYLSAGPASPFFVFYTFILLAGTLRWDWRGALWTTACLVVLLGVLIIAANGDFNSGQCPRKARRTAAPCRASM